MRNAIFRIKKNKSCGGDCIISNLFCRNENDLKFEITKQQIEIPHSSTLFKNDTRYWRWLYNNHIKNLKEFINYLLLRSEKGQHIFHSAAR